MNNILYFKRILQLIIMKKKESDNEAQLGRAMFASIRHLYSYIQLLEYSTSVSFSSSW